MEVSTLNDQNPSLLIRGREEKMSVEILKVMLQAVSPEQKLILIVLDENGFEIYSKPLIPKMEDPDAVKFNPFPEVPVNKRIIFNAFITVRIESTKPEPFSVEVQYV